MFSTYVTIHTTRNVKYKDVTCSSYTDNIKVRLGVDDLSWRIVVIGKIGMLRHNRPDTAQITDGVLFVGCLAVVWVGTGRIVVTKMHRLILN